MYQKNQSLITQNKRKENKERFDVAVKTQLNDGKNGKPYKKATENPRRTKKSLDRSMKWGGVLEKKR